MTPCIITVAGRTYGGRFSSTLDATLHALDRFPGQKIKVTPASARPDLATWLAAAVLTLGMGAIAAHESDTTAPPATPALAHTHFDLETAPL